MYNWFIRFVSRLCPNIKAKPVNSNFTHPAINTYAYALQFDPPSEGLRTTSLPPARIIFLAPPSPPLYRKNVISLRLKADKFLKYPS